MILVVIVHADPSVAPQYQQALAARGIDAEVLCIVTGALSSAYAQLAARAAAQQVGSTLRGLLRLCRPQRPLGEYEHVLLVTYSAGYALARSLSETDRHLCAGLVLLDSGHAALDPDGTAADAGVAWALPWARAARGGLAPMWIGHSDVDPVTYASTTKWAEEVIRLSGGPIPDVELDDAARARGVRRERRAGLLLVRAHDVSRDQMAEHRAALDGRERGGWGPAFVAEAAACIPGLASAPPAPRGWIGRLRDAIGHLLSLGWMAPPAPSPTLGERVAAWCVAEMARGIREIPGPRHHPAIQAYIAPCRRGGLPTAGMGGDISGVIVLGPSAPDETEWCAAGRSAAVAAVLGDQRPPHGRRVSVRELVEDARQLGTWRDVSSGYEPQTGDAWIMARAGEDPRRGGRGHVATQVEPGVTVGGNEDDTWSRTARRREDAVGWIVT